MKSLTVDELRDVVEKHSKWLNSQDGGQRADLRGADLRGAYLQGADLQGADLRGAYLQGADLQGAYLRGAYLRGAYLQGADLQGADLQGAYLQGASGAELAIAKTRIIPATGSFEGWKSCVGDVLVRVLIPADSKRSHAFGRKCRAEFVDVIEIVGDVTEAVSKHDSSVKYRVGERVKCHEWCDDFTQECAGGIHFFITKEEAADY